MSSFLPVLDALPPTDDPSRRAVFPAAQSGCTKSEDPFAAPMDLAGLLSLRHPNLVECTATDAGNRVFTMAPVGTPLSELLAGNGTQQVLTAAGAHRIVSCVVSAVRFLHSQRIVLPSLSAESVYVVMQDTTADVLAGQPAVDGALPASVVATNGERTVSQVTVGRLDAARYVDLQQDSVVDAPPNLTGDENSSPEARGHWITDFASWSGVDTSRLSPENVDGVYDPFAFDAWQVGVVVHQLLLQGRPPFAVMNLPQLQGVCVPTFPQDFERFRSSTLERARRLSISGADPPAAFTAEIARQAPHLVDLIPRLLTSLSLRPPIRRVDAALLQHATLLRHGADDRSPAGEIAMMQLVKESQTLLNALKPPTGTPVRVDLVIAFLRRGADVSVRSKLSRRTALHAAAELYPVPLALELCNLILTAAENPASLLELQDRDGYTPLDVAISDPTRRGWDVFEFMLNRCAELGHPPVMAANRRVLEHLTVSGLSRGLDIALQFVSDGPDSAPLQQQHQVPGSGPSRTHPLIAWLLGTAARNNAIESCHALIRFVPSAEIKREISRAVEEAASRSLQEMCEGLYQLALSAESSTVTQMRELASVTLFVACANNLEDTAEFALTHLANVLAYNAEGKTPLHVAAELGHFAAMRAVFTHINREDGHAATKLVDSKGRTALHLACKGGHMNCCELLLDNGSNPNAADPQRWTPMHFAAKGGFGGVCNLLVGWRAWVDATLEDGSTPTLLAAMAGEIECVRDALVPNGGRLATPYQPHARQAYDHLLLQLDRATTRLNQLDERRSPGLLRIGAPLFVIAATVWLILLVEGVFAPTWPTIFLSVAALVAHCMSMVFAGLHKEGAQEQQQELFTQLMPVRTLLQSVSVGVPKQVVTSTTRHVVSLRRELDQMRKSNGAVLTPLVVKDTTRATRDWVKTFPSTDTSADPRSSSNGPTLATLSADPHDELDFLSKHMTGAVNPGRALADRNLLAATLTDGEKNVDLLDLPQPLRDPVTRRRNFRALWRAFGWRIPLLAASAVLMLTIFTVLVSAVFDSRGARAFHFSDQLATRCTDESALRCSDWFSATDWLTVGGDCCVGLSRGGSFRCSIDATVTPSPPPLVTGNNTPASPDRRLVYLQSAAFVNSTAVPVTEIEIRGCSLTQPNPKMTVRTLPPDEDAATSRLVGGVFLAAFGVAVLVLQILVSHQWAQDHSQHVFFLHRTNDFFATALASFYVHAATHVLTGALSVSLGIRVAAMGDDDPGNAESLAIALAVLCTYPGLECLLWIPGVGPLVAPILRRVYTGLLFVVGLILVMPLIPAVEAFAIPYFVTDPQRAVVSFASVSSPRILYVAVSVFWLLLLLRVLIAFVDFLAPSDYAEHYSAVMRRHRVEVARVLPEPILAMAHAASPSLPNDLSDTDTDPGSTSIVDADPHEPFFATLNVVDKNLSMTTMQLNGYAASESRVSSHHFSANPKQLSDSPPPVPRAPRAAASLSVTPIIHHRPRDTPDLQQGVWIDVPPPRSLLPESFVLQSQPVGSPLQSSTDMIGGLST